MATPSEVAATVRMVEEVARANPSASADEVARMIGTLPAAPAFRRGWGAVKRERHERLVGYLIERLDDLDGVDPGRDCVEVRLALFDARRITGR